MVEKQVNKKRISLKLQSILATYKGKANAKIEHKRLHMLKQGTFQTPFKHFFLVGSETLGYVQIQINFEQYLIEERAISTENWSVPRLDDSINQSQSDGLKRCGSRCAQLFSVYTTVLLIFNDGAKAQSLDVLTHLKAW
jgi:hypothetical protein